MHLVISRDLEQDSWCIKEAIRILSQSLMNTECTYKPVQVTLSIDLFSVMSVVGSSINVLLPTTLFRSVVGSSTALSIDLFSVMSDHSTVSQVL